MEYKRRPKEMKQYQNYKAIWKDERTEGSH